MRRLPLLAALALAPAAAPAQQADTHAIVGARVVTVSGPVHERATIVMRDGLITAVGPDVTPPAGARVIDGKGLVVTPGLIDGLSSIGIPGATRSGSGSGGSGSGAPAATPTPPSLQPQALALERVRAAEVAKARNSGITTALVVGREGVLPGQSAILNLAGDKPEAMVLRQPAALHLHMATATRQYPGSLMGTMAYARQALLDAARARDAWAAWEKAPRGRKRPAYDPALVPWQQVLAGQLPLVVTCTLENDVRRALSLADEFQVKVVLASLPQGFRTAELLKARKLPLLVSVNFDPPRARGFFGGFDDDRLMRQPRRCIAQDGSNIPRKHIGPLKRFRRPRMSRLPSLRHDASEGGILELFQCKRCRLFQRLAATHTGKVRQTKIDNWVCIADLRAAARKRLRKPAMIQPRRHQHPLLGEDARLHPVGQDQARPGRVRRLQPV